MRILRGNLKHRPIFVPQGIRPVGGSLKEAIFDLLGEIIPEASVLDLFAGSGALAIEALSSGARSAVFVDIDRDAYQAVQRNIKALNIASQSEVYKQDALGAVKRFTSRKKQFDIVFVDPPYYRGLARKTLHTLDEYDIVTPHGFVVITCFYKDIFDSQLRNFQQILKKSYGQTVLLIYQNSYEKSDLPGNL